MARVITRILNGHNIFYSNSDVHRCCDCFFEIHSIYYYSRFMYAPCPVSILFTLWKAFEETTQPIRHQKVSTLDFYGEITSELRHAKNHRFKK